MFNVFFDPAYEAIFGKPQALQTMASNQNFFADSFESRVDALGNITTERNEAPISAGIRTMLNCIAPYCLQEQF